jgi:hypothetical protein
MSSSPPASATENDEIVGTMDGEASGGGHAAESAGTAVEAGAAAIRIASSPHGDGQDSGDQDEAMDDYYEDFYDDYDDDSDNDMADVGLDIDEEPGKFSKSAEVEATVEALWRKVVAIEEQPSAGHTCSVCTEHLTCEGAHRIW